MRGFLGHALVTASILGLGCSVLAPDTDELQQNACSAERPCAESWQCIEAACVYVGPSSGGSSGAPWGEGAGGVGGVGGAGGAGALGGASGAGAAGSGGVTCPEGFAECDGVIAGDGCEDLKTDAEHCGACGNACGNQPCVDGACGGGCAGEGDECTFDDDCCVGWCDAGVCTLKIEGQTCSKAEECGSGVCLQQTAECAAGQFCCDLLAEGASCSSYKNCETALCSSGVCTCRSQNDTCSGDIQCCGKCVNGFCKNCGELGEPCAAGGLCCDGQCVAGKCLAGVGEPCAADGQCTTTSCSTSGACACSGLEAHCTADGDCCAGYECDATGECCASHGTAVTSASQCCSGVKTPNGTCF